MLEKVINLGKQPRHANGFLAKKDFNKEDFFEMVIGFDHNTNAIKLTDLTPREVMFNDNYAFYSKTSRKMQDHFFNTANKLQRFLSGGIVVEIGSNDGIMQDAWKKLNHRCIGIEPSGNVAKIARDNGHEVIEGFISPAIAKDITAEHKVGIVYGANVSCHISDIESYFESVATMIGNHGVFVFEDPYFLDVYDKCSYDQFYGEHTWMFTVKFLKDMLGRFDLEIFDLEPLWTHGGSMRYYVCKKFRKPIQHTVLLQEMREGNIYLKLKDLDKRIKRSKVELLRILNDVRGSKICGFGATSKGVVITNYCGIGPDLVPFITDTTPTKIGKYYPGSHIPIVAQAGTDYSKFDYMINFAWNHFEEIRELRKDFKGKWITHVPYPRII